MTIDWDKHAECQARLAFDHKDGQDYCAKGPCESDRAAMIAEGKRLQAENARLQAEAQFLRPSFDILVKEVETWKREAKRLGDHNIRLAGLEAENERLRDFLKTADSNHAHWKERALNYENENERLQHQLDKYKGYLAKEITERNTQFMRARDAEKESARLREALELTADRLCEAICPTTWNNVAPRPHAPECIRACAALEGKP
jgi:chromosome segregation ATPase